MCNSEIQINHNRGILCNGLMLQGCKTYSPLLTNLAVHLLALLYSNWKVHYLFYVMYPENTIFATGAYLLPYNKTKYGFGGLGVACWPLVPKFAGSNPAEAVGFLGRKNSQHAFLRR